MDRSSALTAARELQGFRLSPTAPDVRGWSVMSREGAIAGLITRLFVDVKSRKVRYLEVALARTLPERGTRERREVLVPVGVAHRLDRRETVVVELSEEVLWRAPRIPRRPVTREDENETLRAYGMPVPADASDRDRYRGETFDDTWLLSAEAGVDIPAKDIPARPEELARGHDRSSSKRTPARGAPAIRSQEPERAGPARVMRVS